MPNAMQKQTARNMVLGANTQAAYGGALADAALTFLASFDPSTVFSNPDERYNDAGAVGHGTDYATADIRTAWDTAATVKGMGAIDSWALGWMLALIFGTETVTGAGPYTHAFQINMASALAPCTTIYVEDTADVHRKYTDMSAKSIQIDIPERGPIQATLDMVGTGKFFPGTFSTALPGVLAKSFLLGSDIGVSITAAGAALSMIGRQSGLSFKFSRNTAPFKSSGDGLTAGSNQYGKLSFGVDLTIMAAPEDDVNGWYENMTELAVVIATNPGITPAINLSFPLARVKVNKLGNKDDLVAWQVSFDDTSILQNGAAPALTASITNDVPSYLIPA
jgi:hypothetical protein